MTEANELRTLREANAARQREWDKDNQISLAYRGNELAGEVGEACNVIKKLERERMGIAGSRASKAQLAEELADVIICADLIAMDAGIDLLGEAVPAKFNATSEKVGLATRLVPSCLALLDELSLLRSENEGMRKALEDLVECHDAFTASMGNMEEAYYKLAKYAYPQWQAARAALHKEPQS